MDVCSVCGSTSDLKRCSRCKKVSYCCIEHQKKDWSTHKKSCGKNIPTDQVIGLLENDSLLLFCKKINNDYLNAIFSTKKNVQNLLDKVLIQNESKNEKEKEKYPHIAFEVLLSDYGTAVLLPEIVVSHLNQLFQFILETNNEKVKPFDNEIYNKPFVILINKLIRSLNETYRKKFITFIKQEDIFTSLVSNINVEGIFDFLVEFFENDPKFNLNLLSLFETTLFEQDKSKYSSIILSLLLEKNSTLHKKISKNIFKKMIEFKNNDEIFQSCIDFFKVYFNYNHDLIDQIDLLIDILKENNTNKLITASGELNQPLGLIRLSITEFFFSFFKLNLNNSDKVLLKYLPISMDLLFKYPNHNIYHNLITKIIITCISNKKKDIELILIGHLKLPQKIINYFQDKMDYNPSLGSHLKLIMERIINYCDDSIIEKWNNCLKK
eukprot:gene1635-12760_t